MSTKIQEGDPLRAVSESAARVILGLQAERDALVAERDRLQQHFEEANITIRELLLNAQSIAALRAENDALRDGLELCTNDPANAWSIAHDTLSGVVRSE